MSAPVTIDRRYCGPPDSGNGGYSCGTIAAALGDGPVEVTLRSPPPLDTPLELVDTGEEEVTASSGDGVVGVARRVDLDIDVPTFPGLAEAHRAAAAFDVDEYAATHPFPTCFTCGPARREGDGLRCFPAPSVRNDVTVVWPWTPGLDVAGDDGAVSAEVVWAALDCLSGLSWYADGGEEGAIVLGRMAVDLRRRPAPDEQLVVGGWTMDADGRKRHAGSALWAADGEVLACSRTTWFVLTEDQAAAFGSAR